MQCSRNKVRQTPHTALFFAWLFLLITACQQPVASTVVVAEAPPTATSPAATLPAMIAPPATPTPQPVATEMIMPTVLHTPTAVPTPLPLQNPPNGAMAAQAAGLNAAFALLDGSNTGIWQYPANSFIHPLALVVWGETAVLLDTGRVLQIDLANPQPPTVLLAPGDTVDGALVQEPLDLT
ncbi:MAG: hypothetical protein KDE56_30865, partial [Anaerolineales bacterium]|nr:hypothetical protein [Anaerolineales bacterium]